MENYQLVKDFAAANIPTTTDFEIRVGDHTWKVHSAVLSKKSGYFRALYDGTWSENETRSVTLKESRPVDVARMLQFIYTGEWRYGADGVGSNDSLTLRSLLSSAGTSADVETNIFDVSRIYAIKKEMFNVASYFDIPTLRANIATMLFDHLNMYTEESGDCLQYFTRDFKEIFDLLQPYLGESDQMKEIETRIVKILIEWKITRMRRGNRAIPASIDLDLVREAQQFSEDSTWESTLNEMVRGYAKANGSFAFKLAEELEQCLDRACERMILPKHQKFSIIIA